MSTLKDKIFGGAASLFILGATVDHAHAQTFEVGTVNSGPVDQSTNIGGPEIQVNTPPVQVPVTVNNAAPNINVQTPAVTVPVNVGGTEFADNSQQNPTATGTGTGTATVELEQPITNTNTGITGDVAGGNSAVELQNTHTDNSKNTGNSGIISSNATGNSGTISPTATSTSGSSSDNTNTNTINAGNGSTSYQNNTKFGAITAGVQAAPVINTDKCVGGTSFQIGGGSPFAGSGGIGWQFIGKAGVPLNGHTISEYANAPYDDRVVMLEQSDLSDSELEKLSCLVNAFDMAKETHAVQVNIEKIRQAGPLGVQGLKSLCDNQNTTFDKPPASFVAAAQNDNSACRRKAEETVDRTLDFILN